MLTDLPIVDQLLNSWQRMLGRDYTAYRHHVYRVINLTRAFYPSMTENELVLLQVAAAYHDIGIWTDNTLDYLVPSSDQACVYLAQRPELGQSSLESKQHLVQTMIIEHHRVGPLPDLDMPLAEAFRKADWTDVTFGIRRFGLSWSDYREIRKEFPIAGFHARLLEMVRDRVREAPLSPLPMLRW